MSEPNKIMVRHFERLQEKYPDATMKMLPKGAALITVPDVVLPKGWAREATSIWFIAQNGYPVAPLDCFWAENNLLGSAVPFKGGNDSPVPETDIVGTWFSWHVRANGSVAWKPNLHDMRGYMLVIKERLAQVK